VIKIPEDKCKIAFEIAKEYCGTAGAIPSGYKLRTKTVTVTQVYRSDIGSYNFDIPDAEAPFDEYLGDKIGAVGVDTFQFLAILSANGYTDNEIEEIFDELDSKPVLEKVRLPKPVKLDVDYFIME
jgi:hypothetical protein